VGIGRTAEILEWDEGYVLKLFFKGFPRESIEQEARVGRVINELGLPVAAVREVIEVASRLNPRKLLPNVWSTWVLISIF